MAGAAEESIELREGAGLTDLFVALADKHGPQLGSELAFPGKFMILINGRHFGSLEGMNTSLKNGDTVAVMPVVVGG